MARSSQYNFYVNPETEAELKEFLDSFPKMIRSNFIKTAIMMAKNNQGHSVTVTPGILPSQNKKVTEQLIFGAQGEGKELSSVSDFELDIDDL